MHARSANVAHGWAGASVGNNQAMTTVLDFHVVEITWVDVGCLLGALPKL